MSADAEAVRVEAPRRPVRSWPWALNEVGGDGTHPAPRGGRGPGLSCHRPERDTLERLVEAVCAGEGRGLVVRGEPGVGKSALLGHLVDHARGVRVMRAGGVPTESELAFAGLHQICAPLLDHLGRLPTPQQNALSTALGVDPGPPPDPFLVGLAALSLLSDAAGDRPLLCVVDDEQWLDHASAQALGFVARRLDAVAVGLVVATRVPGDELAGLPELEVEGLPEDEARVLLESVLPGPLDARVRDLVVAETHGNPSALLEFPRAATPFELAGGFGLPRAAPTAGRTDDDLHRRLASLPPQARRLLELAAADPSGDPVLVRRAAWRLGLPIQAATPVVEAGLVELEARVRFRHPLVRAMAYRSATVQHRHDAHAALAEVTDPVTDADRRAWHRAEAATAPDEEVAADLERSAGRARARGGLAAAAAFLERSVLLTPDAACHVDRVLAAAHSNLAAGAFGKALELLAIAEAGPCDERAGARVDLMRGQIAFASTLGRDAPLQLVEAAKRLEALDPSRARRAYVEAWMAASWAGRSTGAGGVLEIARAARALPGPGLLSSPTELALEGLALSVTEEPAAAAPTLRRATAALAAADASRDEGLSGGWVVAAMLWDLDAGRAISLGQVRAARAVGALEHLPLDLVGLAVHETWRGALESADSLVAETEAIVEVTGSRIAPCAAMHLAALRGDETGLASLVRAGVAEAAAGGQEAARTAAHWVAAILHNGHCRYVDALTAAVQAAEDGHPYISSWVLPELIEAAARTGDTRTATDALARLSRTTRAGGTEFGLGIEARSRALVGGRGAVEADHREAIARLGRSAAHPDLARSHLLYGEWLRRQNRRVDARRELRTAHEKLNAIGMAAFAERARRELLATGESVRKRAVETPVGLTSQESAIARLAAEGQTNAEIGAQLFLSARTIEWHLRKVFTKLGVGSRRELRQGLFAVGPVVPSR